MTIALNIPISWRTATGTTATMLGELQPNILKAHVRDAFTAIFLHFSSAASGRAVLSSLASPSTGLMKSAITHLNEVQQFNAEKRAGAETPTLGSPYVGVGVTAAGYGALGVDDTQIPNDMSFRNGMAGAISGDPDATTWDEHFRDSSRLHAIVIVADAETGTQPAALASVRSLIASIGGVIVIGEQDGKGLHNKDPRTGEKKDGIEHFGYVDGRSQPIFLAEDVTAEMLTSDGASNWDPRFGPDRAIVPDAAAPDPSVHFGSYFVFRKLEQNVKLFKTEEEGLAKRLGLKPPDDERAGAMLVGRFEDGTPVTLHSADGARNPVPNDFSYDSDPDGGKCPYSGHIRKMNPRGSGGFEAPDAERLHIMARRGQTYGTRVDDPNDGMTENKPVRDVGLLFMAFNADIGQQFEFVQNNWANNPGFPRATGANPGIDPIIGQGPRGSLICPVRWGGDLSHSADFMAVSPVPQAVTMKGGAYFFMPSLAFLRSLSLVLASAT